MDQIRVAMLCHSDHVGGAARAAFRLHTALNQWGVNATLHVERKGSTSSSVVSRRQFPILSRSRIAPRLARALANLSRPIDSESPRSLNLFRSAWPELINKTRPDVVNVHWIGAEVLSIEDVSRIRAPLMFTMHDAWLFQGGEHLLEGEKYLEGSAESGRWDLDTFVWRRKLKNWQKRQAYVVSPSRWLADIARRSKLLQALEWPVFSISNPIDTSVWTPVDRLRARAQLGWPKDEFVVLFGTADGHQQKHKGFDLLEQALNELNLMGRHARLAVFGPKSNFGRTETIIEGRVEDDQRLRLIYSASDCVVVPSRTENLPNVAVEAGSCGVPVVAFEVGGIPEIVSHRRTGYLARPFEVRNLAEGIEWVMSSPPSRDLVRSTIVQAFSLARVAERYTLLMEQLVERHKSGSRR